MTRHHRLAALTAAVASAFVLAACDRPDDATTSQATPPVQEQSQPATTTAESGAAKAGDEARQAATDMKQGAEAAGDAAADKMAQARDSAADTMADAKETASEKMADAKNGIEQKMSDAKEGAVEMADRAGDAVADAAITTTINGELAKDERLSAMDIDVDTSNGRVALKGTAPDEASKERATQLASTVDGVVSVDNQLTVQRSGS